MVLTAQPRNVVRLALRLTSERNFSDELGAFGQNVGPRMGPFKRTNAEREDYCVRRLLIAWRMTARLKFPVVVQAVEQAAPDYLFTIGSPPETVGLEVTAAGTPEWNEWLSKTERSGQPVHLLPSDDGYAGDRPEQMAARDIMKALEKKAERWRKGDGPLAAERYELLIYDNSEGGVLADVSKVLDLVRAKLHAEGGVDPFAKLHLLSGSLLVLNLGANDEERVNLGHVYDHDYLDWLDDQALAADEGRIAALDLPHVAEELRSMGASERRAWASHLRNLMLHLLKWKLQPRRRSRTWRVSIDNARVEVEALLNDSPSLTNKQYLERLIGEQYPRARRLAAQETGMPEARFPNACPFTLEQIFDETFPHRRESKGPRRERDG